VVAIYLSGVSIFISDATLLISDATVFIICMALENRYPPVYFPAVKIYGIFQTTKFFEKNFSHPSPPSPDPLLGRGGG
jgi:hypothetical protein